MYVLKNKKILVAPLNWGLGHASRCIPLIDRLRKQGNAIAIASDGVALQLLKKNYPKIASFELPSYDISYRYTSMELNMLIQSPKIFSTAKKELKATRNIVEKWKPDIIISDNRFGVRHTCCRSIFLTHQPNVIGKNKLTSFIATWVHQAMITKFDECWIPDYEGKKALAGKMSQAQLSIPTHYLGPLSRIIKKPSVTNIDILVVLSGPEPQRTYFEERIYTILSKLSQYRVHIVRGINQSYNNQEHTPHIRFSTIAESHELNELLNASRLVICRSGYSSMMDLEVLDTPAILVPTPGQYEQEYLAEQAKNRNQYTSLNQSDLGSLSSIIDSILI